MPDAASGPPVVTVPSRLDRRLRLGPFPSGRDALKFLAYAALGATLAPTAAPLLGAPVVLFGLVVAVYKPGGEALDERVALLLRYVLRRRGRGGALTRRLPRRGRYGPVAPLEDGRSAAIVRTAGVPLAYLPPAELARRFAIFRELLRAVEGDVLVLATSSPIFADPVLPYGTGRPGADAAARRGYRELVGLLARRRAVRRVYLAFVTAAGGPEAIGPLEATVAGAMERLSALGVGAERLRDRALEEGAVLLGLGLGLRGHGA